MQPSEYESPTPNPASTLRASIATVLLVAATAASADDISELRERLDEQAQQIKVLERKLELAEEAQKAAAPVTAVVKAGPSGFSIGTPDNANVVKLRGVLHFDGRRFDDDVTPSTADTFILRRVRPTLEGTLNGIFDYRFTPDFAGGRTIILDAFIAARLAPWATVTAGKFKVPVGLERLVSASDLRFIERGFPTSLVPNRDLGVQLSGDLAGGKISYSIGYFNGVNDGGSSDAIGDVENDTSGDWAARIFFTPFQDTDLYALRGLGFGVAGTYIDTTGSPTNSLLGGYRTPGQQTFFSYRSTSGTSQGTYADGERIRITPQAYYAHNSFLALAEYVRVSQDVSRVTNAGTTRSASLDHTAWQIQLAWFLTGEEQSFKGFKPKSVFSPKDGTWGAVELVARYHELDIDDDAFVGGADSFANPATAASKASAWGIGVNWYLNRNYKLSLNYDVTSFDGGAATGDRKDEKALFTRFGLAF
ncbi:MAG: porin [Gammaproteobacteria bacterium]|nr:porin [Gammaproteobacteria bacterium]